MTMLIIRHRINTIEQLEQVPRQYGVEVDVRDFGNKLVLQHDPFIGGQDFEEYLKHYHHALIILNIKSEGVEKKTIALMEKYGINDYFLLDVSAPFIIKLTDEGIRKLAVRYSEFESLETALLMKNRAEWLFVDTYKKLPLDRKVMAKLGGKLKVCVVSPELWGREGEIADYKAHLKKEGITLDAILTKKRRNGNEGQYYSYGGRGNTLFECRLFRAKAAHQHKRQPHGAARH